MSDSFSAPFPEPSSGFPAGPGTPQRGSSRPVRTVLTDLVNVDSRWRALRTELAELRDAEDVRRREREVAEARRARVAADQAAAEDETRLQRLRQDAAKLRARRRDDLTGLRAAVDGERRRDLNHDLAVAERRLGEVEQAIAAEERSRRPGAVGDRVGEAQQALDRAVAGLEEARRRQEGRERELSGQCASLEEHSATLRAELPPAVRSRYENSEKENGVGAAALSGTACRACFMSLDRASLAEILEAPADTPASCPECGTMLLPDREG
ncbi:C4-type zinc ribbon domain-containing protein [Corynebacterium sp.]|uniref:C4-type zinc ribbon domain-containing protein n=1 Tax=Corynebacterium sp. TaxID=1720 RepID=UPI0025C4D76B|nr:C4-type zinc ribbon domain-containing protein [Corynebacterium sp.]